MANTETITVSAAGRGSVHNTLDGSAADAITVNCGGDVFRVTGAGISTGQYLTLDGATDATLALTLNRLYLVPFLVRGPMSVDRIAIEVTTGGSAGSVIRLGIYNSSNGLPSTVLVDAGTVDGTGIAVVSATVAVTLQPAQVWLAAVAQTAAPTVRTRTGVNPLVPIQTPGAQNAVSIYIDSVSGALPTFSGSPTAFTHAPKMYLRGA